jgi:hypothetical protein
MKQAGILLGFCLALLTAPARAQTIAAGARAVVSTDALPVYVNMSAPGQVKATLKRGDRVIIGMVLFGSETTWCAISREGETKRLGYASCEFLEPENAPPSATPAAPAPAPSSPATPSRPKPAPVKIREVAPAPAPAVVHELTPAPVPPPAPTPVTPAPERAAKEPADIAEAVLDGSCLRAEIAGYTQATRISAFLDKGRLALLDSAALNRVLATEFQPEAFLTAFGVQLRLADSAGQTPALLQWLRSDLARKLAGLEQRAYLPASHQSLVEYAAALTATPPPEARLLLIHRIYDATRTCDMEVESTIALVYTTAQAIDPALPPEKRYTSSELDRALGPVKSRYRSVLKNARLVHYLYAFQSISDDELERYARFLESDSGKWLTSAVDKGFFQATESISRRLRDEIPRRVKAKQP